MSVNGTFNLPTINSFSLQPPDPASSGPDSSSQSINPIFLNINVSANPPSTSNTSSPGTLPTPSSSTTDLSFLGHFVPLNNSTNDTISAQLLPSHDASDLQLPTDLERNPTENMPPSHSATVASGSKRKADLDENISGPSLKRVRALPVGQEPFQIQSIIPQESRAGPELAHHIPNQQPQGGLNGVQNACIPAEIPPEIADIHVELNGLLSFAVDHSVQFPSCGHLLTTLIVREDVPRMETRFYPYLWFHGRPPYMLKEEDYGNIFPESHIGAMQNALRRLGIVCGTVGLTASAHRVLFFDCEERRMIEDALKKRMGPNFNNAKWQGAMEIPRQNHVGMGHQQQSGPGHQTEQHPQSGPSSHTPLNDFTTHQTQLTSIPLQPQTTASYYGPSVDSQLVGWQTPDSAVAESSTSSQTRSATPRYPVQNADPFIIVSNDVAKRRRNGPLPILTSVPDTPQAVSGPSMTYPSNTVFAETLTKESFPHPQNTNAAAAPKRKNRRRAPAKSGEKGQNTATAIQRSQSEREVEVAQRPKARRYKKAQDPGFFQIQAGPSGSKEPDTQSVSQQASSTIPQENTQDSGPYTQHQIGLGYNVKEYTPFNNVVISQTPASLTTDQLALATQGYTDYHGDMASQALASHQTNQFGSTDTLAGGYAPLDYGGQFSTANTAPTVMQQLQLEHEGEASGPSGSEDPVTQVPQVSNKKFPQGGTRASGAYTQHPTEYAGNVEESPSFHSVVTRQTPISLPTDQLALIAAAAEQLEGYNGDMTSQASEFGSADTLGGGYYAPLDFGGHYELSTPNTSQPSFPNTSDQTGYADLTAAVSSPNQGAFHNFATGYETGGATTNQTSVSQPSDQVVNVDHTANLSEFDKILATFTGEASYPRVPVYRHGHNQPQPSHMGFDANGGSNLSNQEYQQLITPTPEQNLTYDSFPPAFYLPPQGFVPSGPSGGGLPGDDQAWNFNGV